MSSTHQEENTDPFLELEPQTLYHHQHGHGHGHDTRTQVDVDVDDNELDPSLHEDQRSSGSRTRLTEFASHILGSQDGDTQDREHEHEHDHEHHEVEGGHELSFTGEGGVLESSNHGFHVMTEDHGEEMDEGEFEPHLEEGHLEGEEGDGEFLGETPGPSHSILPGGGEMRVGRKRGAYGKRKRGGDDENVIKKLNHVGFLNHVHFPSFQFTLTPSLSTTSRFLVSCIIPPPHLRHPIFSLPLSSPSSTPPHLKHAPSNIPLSSLCVTSQEREMLITQKEVERKRRNNISEGIDQLVIQMGIPELEKAGKSVQLRRASEWMSELGERVGVLEKEVGDLRGEKLDLEVGFPLLCPLLVFLSSLIMIIIMMIKATLPS